MEIKPTSPEGVYASWVILSQDKAVKHCDKSAFSRLGSSVPKPTRWFWGVQDSPTNTRKKIKLHYQNKDYQGSVNIYSNDLSQIYWPADLHKAMGFIDIPDSYPDLLFERIGVDYYKVTVIGDVLYDSLVSVIITDNHSEGKQVQYYTTKYERSSINRNAAIKIHGTKCMACGFDFEATYGEIGKNFIEVHHTKPLYSLEQETIIDPKNDLICLCSNCHRMIHRKRYKVFSLEELRSIIRKQGKVK